LLSRHAFTVSPPARWPSRFARIQARLRPAPARATEIPFGDLPTLRRELRRGDVAAFIVEPIQGKGVYDLTPSAGCRCKAVVHDAGALLICDEVQTGIGRTGKFYAFEHYNMTPDIITVSKALSGGYVPVGAMLASDKIVRSVYSSMDRRWCTPPPLRATNGHGGGLATLSVFDDEHIVEHSAPWANSGAPSSSAGRSSRISARGKRAGR